MSAVFSYGSVKTDGQTPSGRQTNRQTNCIHCRIIDHIRIILWGNFSE